MVIKEAAALGVVKANDSGGAFFLRDKNEGEKWECRVGKTVVEISSEDPGCSHSCLVC